MSWSFPPPKASEVVARLQALIAQHGDLPCVLWDADTDWLMVPSVDFYPADSNAPDRIELGGGYENTTHWKTESSKK